MKDSANQHHWTQVYEDKAPTEVSWFQATPEPSLSTLDRLRLDPSAPFIDIGGGASNLVDTLLERGWQDLTVLDIAASALEVARSRLGQKAERVHWVQADITQWRPARTYAVWHDRAVFHFMTNAAQRAAYRSALENGVAKDGTVIIATFALDGPERCSGLTVQRYDPELLSDELGANFRLLEHWQQCHVTPWGSSQSFNWCIFRRV